MAAAGEEVRSRLLNKLLKIKEDEAATTMDVDVHDEGEISADDKLADADFFNAFQDDFDDSDIK